MPTSPQQITAAEPRYTWPHPLDRQPEDSSRRGGGEGRPRVTRTTFKGRCRQRHDTDGQTGLPFRVGGGGVKVWGVGVRKVQLFRGQR